MKIMGYTMRWMPARFYYGEDAGGYALVSKDWVADVYTGDDLRFYAGIHRDEDFGYSLCIHFAWLRIGVTQR